jgi:hypothetical protein
MSRVTRSPDLKGVVAGLMLALAGGASAAEPDWRAYAEVLAAHVAPGERNGVKLNLVDYAGLQADPRFAAVVDQVQAWPLAQLATPRERLAFHINAYNILALQTVAAHWPLDSIKDVGSLFKPVWKRPAGRLGGRTVSLDDIEHGILRKLGEPRMHFAIVCASVSCPDLRAEPYSAARLDAQLDDQVQAFLANDGKGLRVDGDTVHVSKIFDWFGADFDTSGGAGAFIRKYHPLAEDIEIEADIDYDWSVNAR